VGGTDTNRAITANDEETINRYVERLESGTPKAATILPPTPGIRGYTAIGTGPIRALFSLDNRGFGVGGTVYAELLTNHGVRVWGAVRSGPNPATISSNGAQGHQNFITSGGLGYIHDTTTGVFSQITDPDFPANAVQGLFFDGYFVVLDGDTGKFQISELYDGLSWNALDEALVNTFPDRIIGMTRTHDNLWLSGTQNTLPYYDSGDANFPFVPIPSSLIEHGTAAPFSCVELDNAPMWLGQDSTGAGMVWRANGYTPQRVSTHAIEYLLLQAPSLSQSVAFGYQEQGHTFYVLYVPGLDWTLCYDISTGLWHKRATWDPDRYQWFPWDPTTHCYLWGKHFVGDRRSGTVYEMSLDAAAYDLLVP